MVPSDNRFHEGDTMSQLLATTSTLAPAQPGRDDPHPPAPAPEPGRSRLWTLIEALAYAGAYIDPSGILAVQRLRQAREEEERNAAR